VVGELVLDVGCAADCGVEERVVAVGEGEGTGAAEVVGAGATEAEVVGEGAGADVAPQSQDMTNRPTPVDSKNSKRP
jgi:glucokinase